MTFTFEVFPSSNDTFVTAKTYNTVSLFINGEVTKTKQFPHCWPPVIAYINGEIIHADGENNLQVLNENLETKTVLNTAKEFDPEVCSYFDFIAGSETIIAAFDEYKVSCFWRHGGREPKVRQ